MTVLRILDKTNIEEDFGTYEKIIELIPSQKDIVQTFSCRNEGYFFDEKTYLKN